MDRGAIELKSMGIFEHVVSLSPEPDLVKESYKGIVMIDFLMNETDRRLE